MAELDYTPLEKIPSTKPQDRIKYVTNAVKDKVVLDLGALDETAYQAKADSEFWLHGEIAKHAKEVIGVDSSSFLDDYPDGLEAFDNSVILKGDVFDLGDIAKAHPEVEVIVAGELIEHLDNPLQFLKNLTVIEELRGKKLIITTPNATGMPNVLLGLTKRESQHIDHVGTHSFKTLNTLMKRAGVSSWKIIPYYSAFSEMIQTSGGNQKLAVQAVERTVNAAQWLFPLLGGGWIVEVEI